MASMFKAFMDILLARDGSKVRSPSQHSCDDNEVLEYPSRPKGIPIIVPKMLMENHKETIQRIVEQAITTTEITTKFYLPTIERFASFVQLLPASQTHHHHDIGGLFKHSLEVGYRALQLADRVLVGGTRTPRQRRDLQPRWQYAVFAAALCHDTGKPLTDVTVSNLDRSISWKPLDDDLYVWAQKNKLTDYHLDWREGRGRQHTSNGNLLLHRIIGSDALQWLELSGMDLVTWLNESLSYNPSSTNLIHELVVKADQFSVERNLKSIGSALVASDQFNAPTERYLVQIMKSLIREGVWRINEPGARVWKIAEYVYIVWPAGGNEMAQHARLDNVPMVPRSAEAILEFLVEREIAIIRDANEFFWEIVPDCLAEKLPGKSLSAIRLRSDSLITTLPIPSIPGKLLNDTKQQKSGEVGYEKQIISSLPRAVEAPSEKPKIDDPVDKQSGEILSPPKSVQQPVAPPEQQSTQQFSLESNGTTQSDPLEKPSESSPEKSQAKAAVPAPVAPPKNSDLSGSEGRVLKSIADALRSGKKSWNSDAFQDKNHVLLPWPASLEGFGMDAKGIASKFFDRNWLEIDPLKPMLKTHEFRQGETQIIVLKLKVDVSRAFLLLANPEDGDKRIDSVVAQGVPEVPPEPVVKESPPKSATSKKHSQSPKKSQLEPKQNELKQTEQKQAEPKNLLTLDDAMSILANSLANPVCIDGWCCISKMVVVRKLKSSRVDFADLERLAESHPDRLMIDAKSGVKFKVLPTSPV